MNNDQLNVASMTGLQWYGESGTARASVPAHNVRSTHRAPIHVEQGDIPGNVESVDRAPHVPHVSSYQRGFNDAQTGRTSDRDDMDDLTRAAYDIGLMDGARKPHPHAERE